MFSILLSRLEKNTHYAEYVSHSSVIAPRILGGIWPNTASAKLSATGETCPKRSGKWQNKAKRSSKLERMPKNINKIFQVAKNGKQIQVAKKESTKYFSKMHKTILSIFVCWVWHSPARTQCSDTPSSVHQRGKASSIVDKNVPCWLVWPSSGLSGPVSPVPKFHFAKIPLCAENSTALMRQVQHSRCYARLQCYNTQHIQQWCIFPSRARIHLV